MSIAEKKQALSKVISKVHGQFVEKCTEFDTEYRKHSTWLREVLPETAKSFNSYPFLFNLNFNSLLNETEIQFKD